ncbi:tripartite tricarboxylate transporter TctB family protein [Gallibacterium anatis]|uniref:tripartite tricarboxylate transporter TctB family protein n=1 Tax=Gallibacterium anatis TaxID=750 RepID=UPI0038D38ABF
MVLSDRTLGVFTLIVSIFLTVFGYDLEAPFSYEPIGPKAFPLLIALVLGICSIILIFKGGNPVPPNPKGANARIFIMLLFVTLYAFSFQWLGFIVSTIIIFTLVGYLFGGKWWLSGLVGIAISILFYLLFDKGLDVILPTGILGGLL